MEEDLLFNFSNDYDEKLIKQIDNNRNDDSIKKKNNFKDKTIKRTRINDSDSIKDNSNDKTKNANKNDNKITVNGSRNSDQSITTTRMNIKTSDNNQNRNNNNNNDDNNDDDNDNDNTTDNDNNRNININRKRLRDKNENNIKRNDNDNNKKVKNSIKSNDNDNDDQYQFHAKPKDLSTNALKHAKVIDKNKIYSHIFSRISFTSLDLNKRLAEYLTKPDGMGMTSSTRVQSVVIPLLISQRSNILMKSQTGSGKTLAYLIPIIDDIMKNESDCKRSDGTQALIIAPTRELCTQIADVLNKITKCCIWIVGGSMTGGENRKSEKARLRKGISILVSTPGRLLDHLRATESFNLKKLRWVVLDEADRLLDMGFEQTILESLSLIRGEKLPGLKGKDEDAFKRVTLKHKWNHQTSLNAKKCDSIDNLYYIMASATLTKAVRQLALPVMGGEGFQLVDAEKEAVIPMDASTNFEVLDSISGKDKSLNVVEFTGDEDIVDEDPMKKRARSILEKGEEMEAPSQLAQYYMMVTCKWRLAAFLSFLKIHRNQKIIVFFLTCDSVDYHALLLRETEWPLKLDDAINDYDDQESMGSGEKRSRGSNNSKTLSRLSSKSNRSFLNPLEPKFTGMLGDQCHIFRLHGNVPQKTRAIVYKEFCAAESGVLLCTDVAARGLDLPKIDWILQYDPPCETTDYVHRIGRTARKGLGGSALIFLLPSEAPYVQLLHSHSLRPQPLSLQSMFQDVSKEIPGAQKFKNIEEMSAIILQRRIETVLLGNKYLLSAARQTFRSFIRAYATHSADTKGIFKVQLLHLGHVAKSFGLRDNPKSVRSDDDVMGKIFNGEFAEALLNDKKYRQEKRDEKYSLSKKGIKSNESGGEGKPSMIRLDKNERTKTRKFGKSLTSSGKFRKSDGYFKKKNKKMSASEFSH